MKRHYFFLLILGLITIDFLTKIWIINNLYFAQFWIVNDWLNIVRIHNTGAAFGIFSKYNGWQLYFLSIIATIISIIMIYWLLTRPIHHTTLLIGLSFIISGALGNTMDRFLYGYVVDFVDFHYISYHYPTFNIADVVILLGAILLIIDMLINKNND